MASGGGGASKGSGSQFSTSGLVETSLSREQASILKKREEQYQEYFFPEIINQLEETKKEGVDNEFFAKVAAGIERNAAGSKNTLSQAMSKRGIVDSGMAAGGELSIEQAKGAALADAYFNSQLQNKQKTLSILQMGGAMSPTPTTAAPVGSESTSYGKQSNSSWNFNAGIGS